VAPSKARNMARDGALASLQCRINNHALEMERGSVTDGGVQSRDEPVAPSEKANSHRCSGSTRSLGINCLIALLGVVASFVQAQEATIEIDANQILHSISRYLNGACIEDVNHEVYGGLYSQMIFGESFQEPPQPPPPRIESERGSDSVSGMWRAFRHGTANGEFALETRDPFIGRQSQRITFAGGIGEIGVENQGLNRRGLCVRKGKSYEGYVWARAEKPIDMYVALESHDGTEAYAERRLRVRSNEWQRLEFRLMPRGSDQTGRFAIKLKTPGSILAGCAFLQPGKWGRFKGLPDRKDVAEALIHQGITALRYGGSMVNAPEYRWKKMIGPRDRRPPYRGTWYPHSSNGWGILDFLNLCEAAGFLPIPDFNMDETPQDMADFVEYVNGPADSAWGRKRVADGHPKPYRLTHLELGNEERVDANYWRKFKPVAEAIWAKDPSMILVVGDFAYGETIRDPLEFKGADSGITSLTAHQEILGLARSHGGEVWFDVHVDTDGPDKPTAKALPSYVAAIDKISDGAKHAVVVFELNANNHKQRRALANAKAIMLIERLGLPVVTSANCLQPDGQNENGWDQGLLFLNPSHVWLQPPGYVTRMFSVNYEPVLAKSEVLPAVGDFEIAATRSDDRKTLVLQAVNLGDRPMPATISLKGFTPLKSTAMVEELAAPMDAMNTAENSERVKPSQKKWRHHFAMGGTDYTFRPYSFTILKFN
jgi:hypothetical protein